MKRSRFIATFVCVHVLFIVLQIHKYTQITKLSYRKQHYEAEKICLQKKKQELTNQLYLLNDRSNIKQYALNALHLEPIKLSQVKRHAHDIQSV